MENCLQEWTLPVSWLCNRAKEKGRLAVHPRATCRRLPTLVSFSFNTQCLCKCTCRESWRLPYAISLSLRFTFCEQIIGRSRPTLVLTCRRPIFMVAYAKLTSWVQNLNTRVLNKYLLNIVFSKASSSLFAGLFFLSAYKTYELCTNSLTWVHIKNYQIMSIKPFFKQIYKVAGVRVLLACIYFCF